MEEIILKCMACGADIPISLVSFKSGAADSSITCPKCKKTFKPTHEAKQTLQNEQVMPTYQTTRTEIIQPPMDQDVAWLELQTGKGLQRYDLTENRSLVGRKTTNSSSDVCIDTEDKSMSRRHFIITKKTFPGRGTLYVLSDANSINHTYLKTNELLQVKANDEYILKNGDLILAGNTTLVFKTTKLTKQQSPQSPQSTVLISK